MSLFTFTSYLLGLEKRVSLRALPDLIDAEIARRRGRTQLNTTLGLPLLSGLRSEQYGRNQPVIADGSDDLEHVTKLMRDSKPGTEIALVFKDDGSPHRIAIKMIRTEQGIEVKLMESVGTTSDKWMSPAINIITHAINTLNDKSDKPITVRFLKPKFDIKGIYEVDGDQGESYKQTVYHQQQYDDWQCSVFAYKAAVKFANGDDMDSIVWDNADNTASNASNIQEFKIPPQFMKFTQSNEVRDRILKTQPTAVASHNPRTQKTLRQNFTERSPAEYISHFNSKYLSLIRDYLRQYPKLENMKDKISYYRASKLTLKRLQEINQDRISGAKTQVSHRLR